MPGLDEPALACPVLDTGYVIRGHPETFENTGFRFPFQGRGTVTGMTPWYEARSLRTDSF